MAELAFVLVIASFVNQLKEQIRKVFTKTPGVKCQLSFLRPAEINGVTSSPNNKFPVDKYCYVT